MSEFISLPTRKMRRKVTPKEEEKSLEREIAAIEKNMRFLFFNTSCSIEAVKQYNALERRWKKLTEYKQQ